MRHPSRHRDFGPYQLDLIHIMSAAKSMSLRRKPWAYAEPESHPQSTLSSSRIAPPLSRYNNMLTESRNLVRALHDNSCDREIQGSLFQMEELSYIDMIVS